MMQLLFFLLFILCRVATVTAVAGCQSDRDKDHRPRQNCTAAGLKDVPTGFEPTVKVLLFPKNLFSSLPWSSFQFFPEIHEIDLTNNKVPEVTTSAAPILPTLSVLRLGSNHLTSLPDDSFSACPRLTELYLENNNIKSLSDNTFSGLSKLEILDLSSNHIKVLPLLLLHPLPAIETLYLEYNKIKAMPDDWFSAKEEVPYLYLSANPWACSCSLGYLRRYLDDYEMNVYVRDGIDIKSDGESVVCDSPQQLKGTPVISLEESHLCSLPTESNPLGDFHPIPTAAPGAVTDHPAPTDPATLFPTIRGYDYAPSTVPIAAPGTAVAGAPSDPPAPAVPTTYPDPPAPAVPTTYPDPPAPAVPTTYPDPPAPAVPTTYPDPPAPAVPVATTNRPTVVVNLHTEHEYHTTVTPSWFQTVTSFLQWSTHSHEDQTSRHVSHSTVTNSVLLPSTESPVIVTTTVPTTQETTKVIPTTERRRVTTSTTTKGTTTSSPLWVNSEGSGGRRDGQTSGAVDVFCFWLFASSVLLCLAAAASVLATLERLVVWYRRVYKPLKTAVARRAGGAEGVRLLTFNRREDKVAPGGGGVMELYRSVLFIHREGGGGATEKREGGGEDGLLVTLKPTGSGGGGEKEEKKEDEEGREERGMYKKTLYRLISKEEEIEGWRDVMEEFRVSEEDGGRRGGGVDKKGSGGGGGVSRKRYSVILREERGEAGGAREELEWVVGGWEVKRGGEEGDGRGEEPRSSWGEWLAHYLPSMPWGVSMPPEGEEPQ